MPAPVQHALSRIARQTVALARAWPKATALLLGLASATGFAPLGLWPVTLTALALLILQIAEASTQRRAFGLGWAFGVGHFALGLNWIATAFTYQAAMPAWLGWIAVVLLSLYLAVYPGLATWGAWLVATRLNPPRNGEGDREAVEGSGEGMHSGEARSHAAPDPSVVPAGRHLPVPGRNLASLTLAFAATWIITEWLRSWVFTGFAWNPLIAVAPATTRSVIPYVDLLTIFGSYGAGAVLILFAGLLLALAIEDFLAPFVLSPEENLARQERQLELDMRGEPLGTTPHLRNILRGILVGIVTVSLGISYANRELAVGDGITITIVQPNVGQQDKWVGAKADANFAKLATLTRPLSDEPRLILWPEAAIPDYLETGYPWVYYDRSPAEARARIIDLMNPDDIMLLGALKLELDKSGEVVGARNAVMTIDAGGRLGPRYDKAHLVPYGEYLPMRPILSAIGLSRLAPGDLDFWPGPGPRTIDLGRFGKVGVQVCYEIIFSGQVVDRANRPAFIFNPSNDAWFGSWGPPQHLAQARLRAIEEGLPVIRATPTGISAVIDADGRIFDSLPMGVADRIDTRLPPPHAPTLFARYGNILPLIFAGLLLAFAIASARRRR
jgi:apolipoprotein N-acyltransferase